MSALLAGRRAAAIVCLLAMLVAVGGCGKTKKPGQTPEEKKIAERKRIEKAKKLFGDFAAESERAIALFESHPDYDAINEQVDKLHKALTPALEIYPSHKDVEPLCKAGNDAIHCYDTVLDMAKFFGVEKKAKGATEAEVRRGIDKNIEGNLGVLRQYTKIIKEGAEKIVVPPAPAVKQKAA